MTSVRLRTAAERRVFGRYQSWEPLALDAAATGKQRAVGRSMGHPVQTSGGVVLKRPGLDGYIGRDRREGRVRRSARLARNISSRGRVQRLRMSIPLEGGRGKLLLRSKTN